MPQVTLTGTPLVARARDNMFQVGRMAARGLPLGVPRVGPRPVERLRGKIRVDQRVTHRVRFVEKVVGRVAMMAWAASAFPELLSPTGAVAAACVVLALHTVQGACIQVDEGGASGRRSAREP